MGFDRGNIGKIYANNYHRLEITVPRALAQALRLKEGDKIEWTTGINCLKVRRATDVHRDGSYSSVTFNKTGAVITRIPKALGNGVGFKMGDSIAWYLESGDLVIRNHEIKNKY